MTISASIELTVYALPSVRISAGLRLVRLRNLAILKSGHSPRRPGTRKTKPRLIGRQVNGSASVAFAAAALAAAAVFYASLILAVHFIDRKWSRFAGR